MYPPILLWKKLFGGTVPPNNTLFGGTVPPNNTLFGGTVPPNNTLFGGTLKLSNLTYLMEICKIYHVWYHWKGIELYNLNLKRFPCVSS